MKEEELKNLLRSAREILIEAQFVYGPTDDRYPKIDECLAIIEDMIMKK